MNMIIQMVFGSHLYGTDFPESDRDYAGVFLPTLGELILQRAKKNTKTTTRPEGVDKNRPGDTEYNSFSLHEFIKLACEGQTIALDMLHAPEEYWTILDKHPLGNPRETYPIWAKIVGERHRFYTRSLHAFVGYARRQAAKYGIKGSRLSDLQEVTKYLMQLPHHESSRIGVRDIWSKLPKLEHTSFEEVEIPSRDGSQHFYVVLGRRFQNTVTVEYMRDVLWKIETEYGERARKAKESEGVDWKAISHAMRAATQCFELLKHKTITFPRPDAAYLKAIKGGKLEYLTVAAHLENTMEDLERLQVKSDLLVRGWARRTLWG